MIKKEVKSSDKIRKERYESPIKKEFRIIDNGGKPLTPNNPRLKTKKASEIQTSVNRPTETVQRTSVQNVLLDKKKNNKGSDYSVSRSKKVYTSDAPTRRGRATTLNKEKSSTKTTTGLFGGKKTVQKDVKTSKMVGGSMMDKLRYGGLDGKRKTVVKTVTREGKNRVGKTVRARRS